MKIFRCKKCEGKMYIFRNWLNRNIKIFYCRNCQNLRIGHNKKIDEFGGKVESENEL
jgi:hypothetical protein